MTNERISQITDALMADETNVKSLFELDPSDAANALEQKGYDFTEEELVEYGKILDSEKKALESGQELAEEALDDVSGGGLIAAAVAGVIIGYWAYGQKW